MRPGALERTFAAVGTACLGADFHGGRSQARPCTGFASALAPALSRVGTCAGARLLQLLNCWGTFPSPALHRKSRRHLRRSTTFAASGGLLVLCCVLWLRLALRLTFWSLFGLTLTTTGACSTASRLRRQEEEGEVAGAELDGAVARDGSEETIPSPGSARLRGTGTATAVRRRSQARVPPDCGVG